MKNETLLHQPQLNHIEFKMYRGLVLIFALGVLPTLFIGIIVSTRHIYNGDYSFSSFLLLFIFILSFCVFLSGCTWYYLIIRYPFFVVYNDCFIRSPFFPILGHRWIRFEEIKRAVMMTTNVRSPTIRLLGIELKDGKKYEYNDFQLDQDIFTKFLEILKNKGIKIEIGGEVPDALYFQKTGKIVGTLEEIEKWKKIHAQWAKEP